MEKFETENDLRLTIKAEEKEILVDEVCCTSVNIILKNDGQIMTSFLGAHNPEIIKNLERTLKLYFKGIKKTLKAKYNELDDCCCGDEGCHGECHDHEHDHEHEHEHKCHCGDDCHCHDKKEDHHKHHEHDEVKPEPKKETKKKTATSSTAKKPTQKAKAGETKQKSNSKKQ